MARFTDDFEARYRKWHWGVDPAYEVEVCEPALPKSARLVEMGRLAELHVRPAPGHVFPGGPRGNPRNKDGAVEIGVAPHEIDRSHATFDMDHGGQRIYLVLSPPVRTQMKKLRPADGRDAPLAQHARRVGGRHGKANDYPRGVRGKYVGEIVNLVYRTQKGKNDEIVDYIHRMGEEGGIEPGLVVSLDGRAWVVGGSYHCPYAGITR